MRKLLKISLTSFITIILLLGFALPLNPVGNWYQQFLPNIGNRQITDITFLDSLTGWIVTNATNQNPDTAFVLKTTNGGDNWFIHFRKIQTGGGFSGYFRIYFLNSNTGYTCGVTGIDKTTNGGANWVSLNAPFNAYLDMSILNTDTIWIASSDALTGGLFRTTNGGLNWQQQFYQFSSNPDNIYMFNARIGFTSTPNILRKTTNGGNSWAQMTGIGAGAFSDIYFTDSLTGWKSKKVGAPGWLMGKTTDGGFNWSEQILPYGGFISSGSEMKRFVNINKDTIWGVGGNLFYPGQGSRAFLYRTTNGGTNWLFQIPDTSYQIPTLSFIDFVNKRVGWAYTGGIKGIHTTNGGDTTWLTGVLQISSEIPRKFKLYQNYPNPFNPKTNIKYQITNIGYVQLIVYDITGREIITLVNQKQTTGTYQVDFSGNGYSSGVYLYALFLNGLLFSTKKMILLK